MTGDLLRLEAEEQARKEAEEQARQEAGEQARKEAGEQARLEAEEQARKEAEEQARQEAEDQARLEAEEQARQEAEEQARKEAGEQARKEAEEQARQEAEEQARKEAGEQARQEAEEQARQEAEEQARKEADEKARQQEQQERQQQGQKRQQQGQEEGDVMETEQAKEGEDERVDDDAVAAPRAVIMIHILGSGSEVSSKMAMRVDVATTVGELRSKILSGHQLHDTMQQLVRKDGRVLEAHLALWECEIKNGDTLKWRVGRLLGGGSVAVAKVGCFSLLFIHRAPMTPLLSPLLPVCSRLLQRSGDA
jgi:hypothetical protein